MTEKALAARVSRALAKDCEVLVKSRSARQKQELGEYYVLALHTGSVVCSHCDLEKLADECGVLAAIPGGDPSLTMKKGE